MSRLSNLFLGVVAPALAICLALLGLETLGSNLLGWFLLVLGAAYPAGSVIYYFNHREPFWNPFGGGEVEHEESGDWSFWLILPGFLVVFFASPLEWIYLPTVLPRTLLAQIAGLVLILVSAVMRIWAWLYIRGMYSVHLDVHANHCLVQSGPYRFVRHPGYTSLLLMVLGLVIGYASLIGLIAIPVLLLPGLAYRMMVEERLLTEKFGEEYQTYALSTNQLIPFLW